MSREIMHRDLCKDVGISEVPHSDYRRADSEVGSLLLFPCLHIHTMGIPSGLISVDRVSCLQLEYLLISPFVWEVKAPLLSD